MKCPVCQSANTVQMVDLALCSQCDHVFECALEVTRVYDEQYLDETYNRYSTTETMSYLRLGFLNRIVTGGRVLDRRKSTSSTKMTVTIAATEFITI